MSNIKLSIITINYNNLLGLQKTVFSVITQSCNEFEYIVIDGGSSDGSEEFLVNQNDTIDYWISEKDTGIYNAMNKGIQKAQGEYLLFLNSGDHLYNDSIIEKVIHNLKDYDLIYSNLEVRGEGQSKIITFPNQLRFSFMFFNTLPHPATFIKKSLFDTIGLYDEKLKIVSDWKFFMIALFKNECTYAKIDEVISCFYLGGISSQMSTLEEKNKVREENFAPYFLDYNELNDFKSQLDLKSHTLLNEINKSFLGRKIICVVLRLVFLLSHKK
jgi:glycosyltransferase involved in cell wall biosynthesis